MGVSTGISFLLRSAQEHGDWGAMPVIRWWHSLCCIDHTMFPRKAPMVARGLLAALAVGCGGSTAPPADGGGGAGGGLGGPAACQAAAMLDRSCTNDADCFAGLHAVDCCGSQKWIGLRATVEAQFSQLEAECVAGLPQCECAAQPTRTDDGSALRVGTNAGLTCREGVCTSFAPECGQPCAAGRTCLSCPAGPMMYAACSTACTSAATCTDPALPLCQSAAGGTTAMFCVASNVTCGTP
jgi:hypothetical protein